MEHRIEFTNHDLLVLVVCLIVLIYFAILVNFILYLPFSICSFFLRSIWRWLWLILLLPFRIVTRFFRFLNALGVTRLLRYYIVACIGVSIGVIWFCPDCVQC